jgi:TPR repeat protein
MEPDQREANGRTAFLLLERASAAGNARAMYLFFMCHFFGIGTPESKPDAFAWLQKSAESGDPDGMYAYSTAIRLEQYEGLGESEALMWLNRSAEVGHQEAIKELQNRQTQAVIGAAVDLFSALGAAQGSGEESEHARPICIGGVGFDDHCRCEGFVAGGGPSEDPSPFVCKSCGHEQDEHSR